MVNKETLIKCGLKKDRGLNVARTWIKKTTNSLLDTVIFEYNPLKNTATVFVQEPKLTRIEGNIDVRDEEDFLDFSWEFYVKYIANYDYGHKDWNIMALAHNKPTKEQIEETLKKNAEHRELLVKHYRDEFKNEEEFRRFAEDSDIVRKQIINNEDLLNKSLDILCFVHKNGINLNLSSHINDIRSEFDIRVIATLIKKGFTTEDIANMIITTKHKKDTVFKKDDSEDTIIKKIENIGKGYAATPITVCHFFYLKKERNGDIRLSMGGENYSRLCQCKHHIGTIGEDKYLRGYYYDVTEWAKEKYLKLKSEPDLVEIMGLSCNHSVYENLDIWTAGVECGLFEKYEKK